MSTNTTTQNRIETSVRNVPFKLVAGMVLLVMGAACMMSLLLRDTFSAFSTLSKAVHAVSGAGAVFLCLFMLWGAVLSLASAYHPVSKRGFVLMLLIFLFVTAAVEIVSRYDNRGVLQPLLDHIEYDDDIGRRGFTAMIGKAADLGRDMVGFGALTFLIAWPLYSVSKVFGFIVALVLAIVFAFMFFRTNPVRIFEKISNAMDARQQKKAEKEKTRIQEEGGEPQPFRSNSVQPAAPVYVPQPVYRPNYMNGTPQQVYDYEPEQYEETPVYAGNSAVEAPAPMEDDYWGPSGACPAGDNIYAQPASQPVNQPAGRPLDRSVSQPVSQPVGRPAKHKTGNATSPVYDQAPASVPTAAFNAQMPPSVYAPVQPAEEEPASDDGSFDLYDEDDTADVPVFTAPAEQKARPARKASAAPGKTVSDESRSSVYAPASAAKDPPAVPAVKTAVKPAEPDEPEEKADSSPDGWVELVRRRRAQAEKKSAPADVLKEEPKQVYTDPVMPITGEKIKLNSQSTDVPAAKPSLDGRDKQKASLVQMEMKLNGPYVFPKWEFLSNPTQGQRVDSSADNQRAQDIVDTLASFHIQSEVKQITHGPAITRFALQIAPGVKVSSVTGAANNIGLTLGTNQIRMETPIQGTNYIGIEVPNASVTPVRLREVLDSPEMHNNPNPLLVALGKDIAGTPILCDLSKMPHLLIAGATGSGKSVCINSIVCSLLYRATPDQVRLIMVDPKQVELQVYNGIPHLLTPVVCDPRKASAALNWVVNEMFERYNKFAAAKVRNLSGYNKLKAGTEEVMYNIVVIIDEMADLMEVCRKDVEESVRRLAALARAAGIYLVLATQRPSVDVITGVIKNNIPSRIAFAVSSNTDSRTIIDAGGAEKLVGKGDMLYKPTGAVSQRVQGCFVTDEEVENIAEFVSRNSGPQYDPNIQEQLDSVDDSGREVPADDGDEPSDEGGSGIDDLLREAIEMAVEDGQTSVSMLQRRLRVGYARAGRLVDEMEKRGIVNKSEGSKPRKTIITREQYLRLLEEEDE